jgi:glycosyltransferase involved in cell wall biosynthesis
MPRVSVIIPAFNSETTLAEAVQSVLDQTYADFEVIVSDDASTDGTAAVAEGFGERVRLVRNPENRGPGPARNAAVEVAEGELLALLDADDYWLPEFLAEQVALYDRTQAPSPGVGMVGCDALVLGPDGMAPGTYRDRAKFEEPLALSGLLEGCPILTNTMVIPRAAFDRVGGFAPECLRAQDHDLFIRLAELGYRIAYNPKPLVVYRIHSQAVSANAATMAHYSALVYRRALDRGQLSRRDRRIASSRLRVHAMAEDLARLRQEPSTGLLDAIAQYARVARRAIPLAVESPRRSLRLLHRARGRRGGISERVAYQHTSLVTEPQADESPGRDPVQPS